MILKLLNAIILKLLLYQTIQRLNFIQQKSFILFAQHF